jgi:hypothetical protein
VKALMSSAVVKAVDPASPIKEVKADLRNIQTAVVRIGVSHFLSFLSKQAKTRKEPFINDLEHIPSLLAWAV